MRYRRRRRWFRKKRFLLPILILFMIAPVLLMLIDDGGGEVSGSDSVITPAPSGPGATVVIDVRSLSRRGIGGA